MPVFLENIKNLLLKKYYDFERSDISLYNFHPQLRMCFALNGIFFNNTNSKLRFIWPFLCVALTFVGIGFLLIFVYHGVMNEDYNFAIESFTYFVIIGMIPICYFSVMNNRFVIISLLREMNLDFGYICNLSEDHRKVFLDGQILIWTLYCLWVTFLLLLIGLFIATMLLSLVYLSLVAQQTEFIQRPLMFPMWLPKDDPYRTPNYEIFFCLQIIMCFIAAISFGGYIYVLFHVLLHNLIRMDVTMLAIGRLFDDLDESVVILPKTDPRRVQVQMTLNARMGQIVRWHISVFRSVKNVSSIYGPPLVYQLGLSAIGMCLIAYKIADAMDNGNFDYLFAMLFIAALAQLWIPCYLGTIIRNKAFDVGEALWNSGWHSTSLGLLLRNDILILISKAQQPVYIKFTGLPNVQLETFSSIVSSSYTYFNMLRHTCK